MIRESLARIVCEAVERLKAEAFLPTDLPSEVEIVDSGRSDQGDFACNFALTSAKHVGKNPREIAEALREQLTSHPAFDRIEVAGPGFVNLYLRPEFVGGFVARVLEGGETYYRRTGPGRRINVEFVSVNPNGPITIGSGRGAAFGSALCSVLEAAGHTVHREYYINDGVNSEQMRLFAESVRFYLTLRIFGEWRESRNTVWGVELLDLIDAFMREMPPEEDIYGAFLAFAGRHKTTGGNLGELARTVLENDRADYYREHRPQQLAAYRRLTLRNDKFRPLVEHFPERGYRGDYVLAVAEAFVRDLDANTEQEFFDHALDAIERNDLDWFQQESQRRMIARQREDLAAFGVYFDTWFSEQSLHDDGSVERCMARLVVAGAADETPYQTELKLGKKGKVEGVERNEQARDEDDAEGAQATLWLRSTKFGDQKDRVLRRRDGRLTYIASDVAYHADKFRRPPNADKLMTILGPDHHGYVGRLTAVVAAMLLPEVAPTDPEGELEGHEAVLYADAQERARCQAALALAQERLEVVIFQLVRFLKDSQPAPMRKRDGNIYALIDLIREIGQRAAPDADTAEQERIGRDVARFFYLMRSHDTHVDFDLDLAARQSDENPVYYAQYAHARICSLLAKADEAGLRPETTFNAGLLADPRETALIKRIADLSYEVARAAADHGVHRIATYAVELARAYHAFYDGCRVLQPDEPNLTQARLALCAATRLALRGALALLGVSAPERM